MVIFNIYFWDTRELERGLKYIESFNVKMQDELMMGKISIHRGSLPDAYVLNTLEEVQDITEEWMGMYNGERPHEALSNLTPLEFAVVGNN